MNLRGLASLFALSLSSLLSPLSAACGGSSSNALPLSDGGATDSSAPGADSAASDSATGDAGNATQACSDWARARCQRFAACSNGLYVTIHWGDETTCETNNAALCATNLSAPGNAATASTFEACATALPTESCSDFLGVNPVSACAALAGSVATGAACITSSQCQSTYCAVATTATCGVCAAVPKAGDPCTVEADCGSRGSLACAAGACVAFGATGASCSRSAPCGIGLSCVGQTKTQPGMCQAAASTVGATCDPKQATAAGCDAVLQLACDPATGTCVENTVVAAGATCGQVSGGLARCAASGLCVVATSDAGAGDAGADAGPTPITGTCLSAAANGAACDLSAGPECVPPARCVGGGDAGTPGTCQVPSATCP